MFRRKRRLYQPDERDDPGDRQAVKARKQKRAGTDPETERGDERKVWWGATVLGLILAFLAGRG